MYPSSLESQLRYRQHGYAWARRFIAGLTVCLMLIAGIAEYAGTSSTTTSAVSTSSPIVVPAEPQCPGDATPTSRIRIDIPNVRQLIFGR